MHRDSDSLPIRNTDDIASERAEAGAEILTADVVVIGSGLAGLVAARECARIGARVVVTGGRAPVAGDSDPTGARSESIDDRQNVEFASDGDLAALIDDLGLGELIRMHPIAEDWWLNLDDKVVPVPQATLVGIPGSPLAVDVTRVLGQGGALRAYLDRLRPIFTIGRATSLGTLVRKRMGKRVWDRMVAPLVAGRFGDDPEIVLVSAVSPALNAAMTRQGSLSGGVNEILRTATATATATATETSARAVIVGGLHQITDALAENCRSLDAALRLELIVTAVDEVSNTTDVTDRWRVHTAGGGLIRARAVILAVDQFRARSLTDDLLGAVWHGWPAAYRAEITTIVLDAPELPRGPRVAAYSAEERISKVVEHLPAGQAGAAHTVRLTTRSFGPQERAIEGIATEIDDPGWPRPIRTLDAAEAALACVEVAELLGVEVRAESVVDAVTRRELQPLSPAVQGQVSRAELFEAAVESHPGLGISGDWLPGPGVDSTVTHARAVAQGIRSGLVSDGFHPSL